MGKIVLTGLLITWPLIASAQKKPVLFVPLGQAEFAYNLVKECPAIDVTWIQEKAEFVVSWGLNEKDNRNDWIVYTMDGKVVGSGETVRVSAAARDICRAIVPK
ncbi:MAG TPA: hypothetical protein VMB18_16230 [Terriglobales bacterium]|jgi:hypothetical protein|nr:hypothetical protein [Terriglobales bacterium]